MKLYPVILIFLLSMFISSCTDTIPDMGKGTLSYADSIIVKGDTFHINSKTVFVDSIISQPDSFLLGTFYDSKFGTVKGEILAQLNYPEGFKFPVSSKVDSAKIMLNYYSCFGSTTSPLDISIYEMTKPLIYTEIYPSNIDPSIYCDPKTRVKIGEQIITAGKNSSTSKSISFKLDTASAFVKKIKNDSYYNSTFTNYFNGIYLTANFGSATMLNIGRTQLNMFLYYHYQGIVKDTHGKDSIIYRNDMRVFPANKEVRQVNCIQHPDRNTVVAPKDTVTYLSSPANLQTLVNLPLDRIKDRLKFNVNDKNKTPYLNSAILKVNITEIAQDTTLHPVVQYVLLIKDDKTLINNIFANGELPTATNSVLGRYTIAQVGTTGIYERYYSFDIAALIANELKNAGPTVSPINLRMIPVAVETATNSNGSVSITGIKQQYLMNAVTLSSGKSTTSPTTLKLIYSGF
ncbi:MAG: DUF4270 domain-containing protein [Paludibacter sp.]